MFGINISSAIVSFITCIHEHISVIFYSVEIMVRVVVVAEGVRVKARVRGRAWMKVRVKRAICVYISEVRESVR